MKRELTAKEHGDMLEKDPKYQAMMAEKEREWAKHAAMLEADAKPLVKALTAAGWPEGVPACDEDGVRSVWDLVNTVKPYPHLLDTLGEHISRPYNAKTREGIARALAVKEARDTHIPRLLMDELKKLTEPKDNFESSYRWALINTLVFIGDSSMTEEVRQLLADTRYAAVKLDLQRLAKAVNRHRRTNQRRLR